MVSLKESKGQAKSLNELVEAELTKIGESERHGLGNTVPKCPAIPELHYETPFWESEYVKKKDEVSMFFDWMRWYGGDCLLSAEQLQEIVIALVAGKFFARKDFQGSSDLFPVYRKIAHGQIHKGSSRTWTYCYSNGLGVKIHVCSDQLNSLSQAEKESWDFEVDDKVEFNAISIEFSGSPLSSLVPRNNQLILAELAFYIRFWGNGKINLSRSDTAVEFPTSFLDLQQLASDTKNKGIYGAESLQSYNNHSQNFVRKQLKKISDDAVRQQECDKWLGKLTGLTVYVGSANSRKKIRIYNTLEKHNYSSTRLEVQNSDDRARMVEKELIEIYQQYYDDLISGEQANRLIIDFIKNYNFSYKTLHPCNKFPCRKKVDGQWITQYFVKQYWLDLIEKIEASPINYKFSREKSTIQKSMNWLINKVSSTLAVLGEKFGDSCVCQLVESLVKISKNGIGCQKLEKNINAQDKINQIESLGSKAIFDIFSEHDKERLKSVGFFRDLKISGLSLRLFSEVDNFIVSDPKYFKQQIIELPF